MLLLREQKEGGNFVFPWFWAAAVAQISLKLGSEDLAFYSLELQYKRRIMQSMQLTADFLCFSLGRPALNYLMVFKLFC